MRVIPPQANSSPDYSGHLSRVPPHTAEGDLPSFDEKLAHLRSTYEGPLIVAEDLMCIPVGPAELR